MSSAAPLQTAAARPLQTGGTIQVLQRKCACGAGASGLTGECEECSKKKMVRLQTKLRINEPGDAYEQEADRVAEQVLAQRAHPGVSNAPPRIQRFSGQSSGQLGVVPVSVDHALASPGRPLEPALRQDMEQRFGHDFSQVRVHSGASAEQSARDVNAYAYTVGRDVVFGAGQYVPATAAGRRLLAHELTHVVQQSPTAVARAPQTAAVPKKPKCHTGCAGHWGQDTTCSRFGFKVGVHEREPEYLIEVKGNKLKLTSCCNTWPFSLEEYARDHLGLDGAASCTSQHAKEIATVTAGGDSEKKVKVLCSDTISVNPAKSRTTFGETGDATACSMGNFTKEVIELSPNAMEKLSGSNVKTLLVKVCYSGSQEDLCSHNGPGKASFPEVEHCLTEGCDPKKATPKLRETGWPRS